MNTFRTPRRFAASAALLLAAATSAVAWAQGAGPAAVPAPTAPTALSPVGSPPSAIGAPVVPSGVGAPPSVAGTLPSPGATLPSGTLANPNPSPGALAASRSFADPSRAAGADALSNGADLCPASLIRTAAGCVPISQARSSGDNTLYRRDFKR